MAYFVGLDLGGTNIKAGLVDDQGKVLAKLSIVTQAQQGPATVVANLIQAAHDVTKQSGLGLSQVAGIGVGSPGMLDFHHGIVKVASNLPGFNNIAVCEPITQQTGRPAVLENDANAAAMGECWVGAGRAGNVSNLVMLTLGTGVGSGIVVDGHVIHGHTGLAGEAGHLILVPNGEPCPCGQKGCLERYTSANAVAMHATRALQSGRASSLQSLLKSGQELTSKHVFDAADAGDALALEVVDQVALHLGVACITLARLLDPQMIVIGGGMIAAGDSLISRVQKSFTQQHWHVSKPLIQIVPARLGTDAGFIGAAAVAWDAHRSGKLPR